MARTFRRPRNLQPVAELNVTNMIDLGFTLLIIFMIATPLINSEQTIPVNLPVESKKVQTKPDKDTRFESITVKPDGSCMLGARQVTTAQLDSILSGYAQDDKPPVFRIRMDSKSTAQQFITVMDLLNKHQLSKISFDTQTTD